MTDVFVQSLRKEQGVGARVTEIFGSAVRTHALIGYNGFYCSSELTRDAILNRLSESVQSIKEVTEEECAALSSYPG